jgi:ATP-grasp ribosomal peptide maturase
MTTMTTAERDAAPTVLVVTGPTDFTADLVILRLAARGARVARFDLAEFPAQAALTGRFTGDADGWDGTLHTERRTVRLADVRAVWWRKPGTYNPPAGLADVDRTWCRREATEGVGGILRAALRRAVWVNRPERNRLVGKPGQLAVAAACGLAVPDTLITNDPAAAREFVQERAATVYKSLRGPVPITESRPHPEALPTTSVGVDDITDGVSHAPHLFQERIDADYAVRIVVVAGELFALRIDAHTDAGRRDWRTDQRHLTYRRIPVPRQVSDSVRMLMTHYRLVYGALDFLVEHDRWWYLETNPNGQWAWGPQSHQDAVADALAAVLAPAERVPG